MVFSIFFVQELFFHINKNEYENCKFMWKMILFLWGPIDPRGTIQVERAGSMPQ